MQIQLCGSHQFFFFARHTLKFSTKAKYPNQQKLQTYLRSMSIYEKK